MDPMIWVALISAATTLLIAFGPKWRRSLLDKASKLDEVHEQVKNTHSTNLREDLDVLLAAVNGLREDMRTMRDDQVVERRERFALSERVDEALRKLVKET